MLETSRAEATLVREKVLTHGADIGFDRVNQSLHLVRAVPNQLRTGVAVGGWVGPSPAGQGRRGVCRDLV